MKLLACSLGLSLATIPHSAPAGQAAAATAPSVSAAAPSPAPLAATATPAIDLNSLKSGPFRADAMEFAQTTMPEKPFHDMMVSLIERGFREGLGDDAAALEKASPGVIAELQAAVRDVTAAMRTAAYHDTLKRYARLYSRVLTPADTAALAQFYRGPTGKKLIAAKYAALSSDVIALDRDTTDQDVTNVNRQAVGSALSQMDATDMVELTKFAALPAFQKLKTLLPTVNQLEAAMANEEDVETEQAVANAVDAVMKRRGLGD